MSDELFDTKETASQVYLPLFRSAIRIDSSSIPDGSEEDLSLLRKIERSVQRLDLISPNEDFEEIGEEILPFLFLPLVLARAERAQASQTVASLDSAEKNFRTFLSLAKHYKFSSDLTRKLELESQEPGFSVAREDKIALYREELALKAEAERVSSKGEPRATFASLMRLFSVRTANWLLSLPQERQILQFKEKLEKDPEVRAEYEKSRAEPVPPPKILQIKPEDLKGPPVASPSPQGCDGCGGHEAPSVVASFPESFNEKLAGQRAKMFERASGNQRLELLARLNQPSHAQPTMTGDEFDELEFSLMKQKEKQADSFRKQKEEWKKKEGIEDSDDSDNEKVAEIKRLGAAEWDEFKDNNEKGAGNRNGK